MVHTMFILIGLRDVTLQPEICAWLDLVYLASSCIINTNCLLKTRCEAITIWICDVLVPEIFQCLDGWHGVLDIWLNLSKLFDAIDLNFKLQWCTASKFCLLMWKRECSGELPYIPIVWKIDYSLPKPCNTCVVVTLVEQIQAHNQREYGVSGSALPLWIQHTYCSASLGSDHCFQLWTYKNCDPQVNHLEAVLAGVEDMITLIWSSVIASIVYPRISYTSF